MTSCRIRHANPLDREMKYQIYLPWLLYYGRSGLSCEGDTVFVLSSDSAFVMSRIRVSALIYSGTMPT